MDDPRQLLVYVVFFLSELYRFVAIVTLQAVAKKV